LSGTILWKTLPISFSGCRPAERYGLRYAYFVKCTDVIKDEDGNITEVHCTYDPESRGGNSPDGRKVKATLHWVSAAHAIEAEVRLYDRLFTLEDPSEDKDQDFKDISESGLPGCFAHLLYRTFCERSSSFFAFSV
jgi:glutaminyl-tRNA synthetase